MARNRTQDKTQAQAEAAPEPEGHEAETADSADTEQAPEAARAEGTTEQTVDANAPVEESVTERGPDAQRAAAIAALANGTTGAQAQAEAAPEPDYDTDAEAVPMGGRTKALVLFDRYNIIVDGIYKTAKQGVVIAASKDEVDRGVRLGGLRKIEG